MNDQRLIWLYDRMLEGRMKLAHVGVMAALLGHDAKGLANITKAQLGALVGLQERQVANVLRDLESDVFEYIKKQRHGGAGRGRAANSYLIRPDATGNPVPVNWSNNQQPDAGIPLPVASNQQSSAGSPVPVADRNRQPSAGNAVPVANKKNAAPIEHADARGEIKPSYLRGLELNPDTESPSSNSAGARPAGWLMADRIAERVNSPYLDPSKQPAGLLYRTSDRIAAWIKSGADVELDIIPTIQTVCAKLNGHGQPIERWGYFDKPIAKALTTRLAASLPLDLTEAAHEQRQPSRTPNADPGVRRRQRSPLTERAMRLIAEGDADGYGRVDSVAIK